MLVTLVVSQLPNPRTPLQSRNVCNNEVTCATLHPFRSAVIFVACRKVYFIEVTELVFHLSTPAPVKSFTSSLPRICSAVPASFRSLEKA